MAAVAAPPAALLTTPANPPRPSSASSARPAPPSEATIVERKASGSGEASGATVRIQEASPMEEKKGDVRPFILGRLQCLPSGVATHPGYAVYITVIATPRPPPTMIAVPSVQPELELKLTCASPSSPTNTTPFIAINNLDTSTPRTPFDYSDLIFPLPPDLTHSPDVSLAPTLSSGPSTLSSPPPAKSPPSPASGDGLKRPSIRPTNASSKFDLEPNVFEQSFSKSSNSIESDRTTPPRGGDATAVKHNALPPLSSLTSPAAADPSQFPWLANQSLRTGPLSPAMLAGPQGHSHQNGSNSRNGHDGGEAPAFDGTTFRTGFTPGTGSGFTPGYSSLMNGASFSHLPMPSPNTAAFLNMVTNSTPIGEGPDTQNGQAPAHDPPQTLHPPSALPPHMQPHHGLSHINEHPGVPETITPNTLSALTGVYNEMNRNPPPASHHPPYFNQSLPPPVGPPMPPQMGGPVDYAQQSANAASQAANGLFLLSQAHQELSKREEEGRGTTPLMGKKTSIGAAPPGSGRPPNVNVHASSGQKRKSDGGAAKPAAKRGKKSSIGSLPKDDSTSPMFGDSDDDDDEKPNPSGKPETEEEKRKNFLERNRQAALKCRQRKKAWLNELQSKVEHLTVENERLQQTIAGLHDEVGRLSGMLMQHRDCGLGIPPAYGRPIR